MTKYYVYYTHTNGDMIKDGYVQDYERDSGTIIFASMRRNGISFDSKKECKDYISEVNAYCSMPNIKLRPCRVNFPDPV